MPFLIVEFAEQLRGKGMSVVEAAVEAARIRLRPILMTSLAFILGVVPLVLAQGGRPGGPSFRWHDGLRGMIAATHAELGVHVQSCMSSCAALFREASQQRPRGE